MSKAKELLKLLENMDRKTLVKQLEEADEKYDKNHTDQLLNLYNEFQFSNKFEKGQIVKWKKGLKNKRLPRENQPAIVIELLDEPIYSDFNSGTPYFREPLDLLLGFIGMQDDFIIFYYDKRRFEPIEKNKE